MPIEVGAQGIGQENSSQDKAQRSPAPTYPAERGHKQQGDHAKAAVLVRQLEGLGGGISLAGGQQGSQAQAGGHPGAALLLHRLELVLEGGQYVEAHLQGAGSRQLVCTRAPAQSAQKSLHARDRHR
jgi:hypothetical protein